MKKARLVRAPLAILWLASGASKLTNPWAFVASIENYDLVLGSGTRLIGFWLPGLEVLLGLCFLCGILQEGALFLSGGLFALFGVVTASVMFRGLSVDCGCFGDFPLPVTWAHSLLCFALCLLCWLRADGVKNPGQGGSQEEVEQT